MIIACFAVTVAFSGCKDNDDGGDKNGSSGKIDERLIGGWSVYLLGLTKAPAPMKTSQYPISFGCINLKRKILVHYHKIMATFFGLKSISILKIPAP